MRPNYPFNCWYIAAASEEIAGLFARRVLDQPVVMFRRGTGEVVAMEDRCLHRAYPLSKGRIEDDRIVCGYHGCTYDADGRLVDVPSQENVPPGARVRTYPIHEKSGFVWLWLGEPAAARLRPPPRIPWSAEEDGWGKSLEVSRVRANYLLLHEHYLDLTNVFHMYPEAAPPDIHTLPPLNEVEVSELSVSYSRLTVPTRPASWEMDVAGLAADTKLPRVEEGIFVSPALHVQRYIVDPDGEKPYVLLRVQGFTPESHGATHVFLQIQRNYAIADDRVTVYLRTMFHEMGKRDQDVLETVQQQLDQETRPRRDLNFKADRAAIRARRIAQQMVDDERFVLR
ncbi:Rieske 2Fe-2S domain-containing protein [Hoyosella altamirensis]|uniref:Vanillate O-demethylase monooxygenase subunit n=1 Tax=Hoyosella altamirensis TaxID=616997 RepID=A0A839RL80_9ACTN|nr:Rieske 2Fe-2S domain-containing protein [Hoyosella altamirensis]MBB3036914.1 vanillate O-demethylase monooxygenase subunit [Hoyosella altamirensis]